MVVGNIGSFYGVVILIAVGLCNIIARILLLKTVLIWRGVRVSDGAAGGRSEGQGLVFFSSVDSWPLICDWRNLNHDLWFFWSLVRMCMFKEPQT